MIVRKKGCSQSRRKEICRRFNDLRLVDESKSDTERALHNEDGRKTKQKQRNFTFHNVGRGKWSRILPHWFAKTKRAALLINFCL